MNYVTVISCDDKLRICPSKADLLKKIQRYVEAEAFMVPVSLTSSKMQWRRDLTVLGSATACPGLWGNSVGSIVKLLSYIGFLQVL